MSVSSWLRAFAVVAICFAARAAFACETDAQCKGGRVCIAGRCTAPDAATPSAAPGTAASPPFQPAPAPPQQAALITPAPPPPAAVPEAAVTPAVAAPSNEASGSCEARTATGQIGLKVGPARQTSAAKSVEVGMTLCADPDVHNGYRKLRLADGSRGYALESDLNALSSPAPAFASSAPATNPAPFAAPVAEPVAVQRSPESAPVSTHSGFGLELALRGGFGLPFGKVGEGSQAGLGDVFTGLVPFELELGLRFNDYIMLGLYGQYAVGIMSSGGCGDGFSCSGSDARFGGQLHFHMHREGIDPWIGLGFGYEWLSLSSVQDTDSTNTFSLGAKGFEYVNFQIGIQFPLGSVVSIGPFATITLASYGSQDVNQSGSTDGSGDISNTSMHEMLYFGIRLVIAP